MQHALVACRKRGIGFLSVHDAAGSSVSSERIARFLNGSIVLVASLLCVVEPRFIWLVLFMGASLIYSGASGFCGFKTLLDRIRSVRDPSVRL